MKLAFFLTRTIAFSLSAALLFASCNAEKEQPVTPGEAKDFARQVQSSIEKRNPDFYNTAIDKKTFLKKAGLSSGKNARSFGSGLDERLRMGTTMVNSLSKKGTYQLVKQYEKDGKQHVLFRMYDDGSLNYHDIELVKTGKEVKIGDIFVYTSGEYLSETIKNLFEQMKGMMENKSATPESRAFITDMPRMRELMNQKRYEEAIGIYDRLPSNIKQLRAVQIIHILISSGLEDQEKYSESIEQYKSLYPNEPNMHLLLLDGYLMKKEYDQALYSVNEMDRMINKDPFLDYYRSLIYKLKEDNANRKLHIERLMKNMPDSEDGMLELIAVYLEEKNKAAADEWIEKYKMNSAYDQDILNSVIMLHGGE